MRTAAHGLQVLFFVIIFVSSFSVLGQSTGNGDKVYRLSASVYALDADTDILTVVTPGDDQASAGEITVTPQTGDTGLASAGVGDTVVLTGTFSGSPVDTMTCTAAAEVYPNPLWGAADGDTFHWTEDAILVVPWRVRTLTITGGGAPVKGSIRTDYEHPGLDLTIENLKIDARGQNYFTFGIDGAESLTVKGACAVSADWYEITEKGYIMQGYAVVVHNVRVEAGASLLAVGDEKGCFGPGVAGAIMGGVGSATLDDQSGGGMGYFDTATLGPTSGGLDLSNADAPTAYLYPTGTVRWIPADGETPARLALTAMEQGPSGSGLYLADGVTLPENTAVDVVLSANTAIENNSGPAVTAPGGSVSFTGGIFQVYGNGGASDAPIAVRGGLGCVEMLTEAAAVPAGITVDPAGAVSRAACHAELTVDSPQNQPRSSNSALTYNGTSSYVKAAIVAGTLPTPDTYAVTYKANYMNGPADVPGGEFQTGETVTVLTNPFPAPGGKTFAGWAETADGPVQYKAGATFQMPAASVDLYAVWENPFTDVSEDDWFYLNVAYVHQKGLFAGVSDTAFHPNVTMSRAMLWTVLARLDGQDTTGGTAWYEQGPAWAMAAGISDGTHTEGSVTREQVAAMLYRYAEAKGLDVSGRADLSKFGDVQSVSTWAAEALSWANARGIVTGKPGGLLDPQGKANRAEVAAMLQRDLEGGMKQLKTTKTPDDWDRNRRRQTICKNVMGDGSRPLSLP